MKSILSRLRTAAFWRDALERAFSNAWEAVVGLALITPAMSIADVSWQAVLGYGGAAALAAVIIAIVHVPDAASEPLWSVLFGRALRTYLGLVAATLAADAVNLLELDWRHVLAAPVVPALLAVVKNYLSPPSEVFRA